MAFSVISEVKIDEEEKDGSASSSVPSPKAVMRPEEPMDTRQQQEPPKPDHQIVFPQWQPASGPPGQQVDNSQRSCAQLGPGPSGMMMPNPGSHMSGMGGDFMHHLNSAHYGQSDMMGGPCPPQIGQHPGQYSHTPMSHHGPPMSLHEPQMAHSMSHAGSHMDPQTSHMGPSMSHMGQSSHMMSHPAPTMSHSMSHAPPPPMSQVPPQMSQYGQSTSPPINQAVQENRSAAPPAPPAPSSAPETKDKETQSGPSGGASKEPIPATLDDESMSRIAAAEDRGLSYVTSVYTGANKGEIKPASS